MKRQDITKLYYHIGEVSQLTGVDQHVLRYWESEFRELAPRKNRGGKRLYRDGDLKVIRRIKQLLYEERYTIEGARRRLKEKPVSATEGGSGAEDVGEDHRKLLSDIKKGLTELKEMLEE